MLRLFDDLRNLRKRLDAVVPPGGGDGLSIGDAGLVELVFTIGQHCQNDLIADVVIVVHPHQRFLLHVAQRSAQLLLRNVEQRSEVVRVFQCGGDLHRTQLHISGAGEGNDLVGAACVGLGLRFFLGVRLLRGGKQLCLLPEQHCFLRKLPGDRQRLCKLCGVHLSAAVPEQIQQHFQL